MSAFAILKQVAGEHGFTPADLRTPTKMRGHVLARRAAMVRLKQAGYSIGRIGIICQRSPSTVEHHLYPQLRANKEAQRLRRQAA